MCVCFKCFLALGVLRFEGFGVLGVSGFRVLSFVGGLELKVISYRLRLVWGTFSYK